MNAPREGKAQIDVPLLQVWSKDVPLEQLAAYVDYLPRHEVAFAQSAPTPPSALPRVQTVAHDNEFLVVKFFVTEKQCRAQYLDDNSPVYQDSCVEVFLQSHSGEPDLYYNFEFNLIGTVLGQRGISIQDRQTISAEELKKIRRLSSLPRLPFDEQKFPEGLTWSLLVVIPRSLFGITAPTLAGVELRGNFYKCGDGLTDPHWLSLFPVTRPDAQPAFHVPTSFGRLNLAASKAVYEGVPDNPIAQARAHLHMQRGVGVRPTIDPERAAAVEHSRLIAEGRHGKVKNDSPELLNALLKWYQSDVEQKRKALANFFSSLPREDRAHLLEIVSSTECPPAAHPHPNAFDAKAAQWRGLAASHGQLFIQLLQDSLLEEQGPTKEDMWAVIVQDYLAQHPEHH